MKINYDSKFGILFCKNEPLNPFIENPIKQKSYIGSTFALEVNITSHFESMASFISAMCILVSMLL
jgi:hypothetical protein